AHLIEARLSATNLSQAELSGTRLGFANLSGANLISAGLIEANLSGACLKKTILTGYRIYGISAWSVNLAGARQQNLVITNFDEATITVDNLEIAQFIYVLLNNAKIRSVIDTITSKVVLILGRFTPERKAVLDAIREELRKRNYLPALFDSDKPMSRNMTETVSTLAHMARFVIADITDARSIADELRAIVPALPSVPVQPLLLASDHKYGMLPDPADYPSVLKLFRYKDVEALSTSLGQLVTRVETKVERIKRRRSQKLFRAKTT